MSTDDSLRLGKVPDAVLELIDIVKSEKAKNLFFVNNQSTVFLNKDLQIDQLKKDITETNDKINSIAGNNIFIRELTENESKDEFFKWGITQDELNQYVEYKFDKYNLWLFKEKYFSGEDVDQEITLPKFDLITDFLALLEYYDKLNEKLAILQKVDEAPTTGQSNNIDFNKLENSNLPVIDTSIFDPDFIFNEYHNKAFTCSRFAYDALLVHGKKCDEKITWIFKTRGDKVNKAQLKMFIDKITNTDTAKKAYFINVFGLEVKKADYKNASTLNAYFKELSHISDKKKFLK